MSWTNQKYVASLTGSSPIDTSYFFSTEKSTECTTFARMKFLGALAFESSCKAVSIHQWPAQTRKTEMDGEGDKDEDERKLRK